MYSNVKSEWVDGDLVFSDQSGTEIARFDSSAATLDIKKIAINGTEVTATAAELNKLDGAGAVVASGTAHALIADVANDASGTLLAAAINGIIDTLQAFGMVATS